MVMKKGKENVSDHKRDVLSLILITLLLCCFGFVSFPAFVSRHSLQLFQPVQENLIQLGNGWIHDLRKDCTCQNLCWHAGNLFLWSTFLHTVSHVQHNAQTWELFHPPYYINQVYHSDPDAYCSTVTLTRHSKIAFVRDKKGCEKAPVVE